MKGVIQPRLSFSGQYSNGQLLLLSPYRIPQLYIHPHLYYPSQCERQCWYTRLRRLGHRLSRMVFEFRQHNRNSLINHTASVWTDETFMDYEAAEETTE